MSYAILGSMEKPVPTPIGFQPDVIPAAAYDSVILAVSVNAHHRTLRTVFSLRLLLSALIRWLQF